MFAVYRAISTTQIPRILLPVPFYIKYQHTGVPPSISNMYFKIALSSLPVGLLLITQTLADTVTVTQTTVTSTATVAAAAATSDLSPTYTNSNNFTTTMLNYTNYYRYLHSVPFLEWNDSVASYAADYAQKCVWEHNPQLGQIGFGENLAQGYGNVSSAVAAWYDEVSMYSFGNSPTGFSEATGHFSQLVWKSSVSVGCGWTDCQGKGDIEGVMLVCDYYPAGNVEAPKGFDETGGSNAFFVQNVMPEKKGKHPWDGFNETAAEEGIRSGNASATGSGSSSATSGAASGLVVGGERGGRDAMVAAVVMLGALMFGAGLV